MTKTVYIVNYAECTYEGGGKNVGAFSTWDEAKRYVTACTKIENDISAARERNDDARPQPRFVHESDQMWRAGMRLYTIEIWDIGYTTYDQILEHRLTLGKAGQAHSKS